MYHNNHNVPYTPKTSSYIIPPEQQLLSTAPCSPTLKELVQTTKVIIDSVEFEETLVHNNNWEHAFSDTGTNTDTDTDVSHNNYNDDDEYSSDSDKEYDDDSDKT